MLPKNFTSQTFPTKLAAFWCGLLFRLHSLVLVNYPYLLLNMTDYRSKCHFMLISEMGYPKIQILASFTHSQVIVKQYDFLL